MASILGDVAPADVSVETEVDGTPDVPAREARSTVVAVTSIVVPRLVAALALAGVATHVGGVGSPGSSVRAPASGLLNWDAGHYLTIAEHGYTSVLSAPFLPLEPLLIRPLAEVLGFPNAAVAVSWLSFAFAVWGIIDLATRLSTRRGAIAAALLFAWGPVSVFFVAGYAESVFVALTVWSLRFCLDRRWVWAAVLAGAASAAVPQGVCMAVVVVVGVLMAERGVRRVVLAIGCGIIGEAGLVGFALYSWKRYGNALEFRTATQTFWGDHLTYPFHVFVVDVQLSGLTGGGGRLVTEGHFIYFANAAAAVVTVAALAVAVVKSVHDRRWILPTLFLVLAAGLSVSTLSAWADGEARFLSALVTVYLSAAVVFERLARRSLVLVAVIIVPSAALAIYFERLFNMVHWLT